MEVHNPAEILATSGEVDWQLKSAGHPSEWARSAAMAYHEATKHSEISIGRSAHYLDWENKPSPFKTYKSLPRVSLPTDLLYPLAPALKAVAEIARGQRGRVPDIGVLAEILFFSAGLTRKMRFGSETHYMRAASATGALYPIELYVVTGDPPGLEPGVYHFNPLEFELLRLRDGDFRSDLARASDDSVAKSTFTIVMTSMAWRNAWKYEARSYRHWFWDSGVIVANLLATCSAEDLPCKICLGFADANVDKLLGLEESREAAVCLAAVGEGPLQSTGPVHGTVPELRLNIEPLSRSEVDYPTIWQTNKAGVLAGHQEVEAWKSSFNPVLEKLHRTGPVFQLRPLPPQPSRPLSSVILQRGSSRRFSLQPISFEALSTIIKSSSGVVPLDFLPEGESLIDFYFIANAVEGLPSGAYHYHHETGSIEQLKAGSFRSMSGYLSLGQPLFSQASVMFFLTADLEYVIRTFGDRGYRAAQFEAGVRAGKVYLSSYALDLGASGSTFYDDAVTEFFSPWGRNASPMIAVGVGVPGYKARSGTVLPQSR